MRTTLLVLAVPALLAAAANASLDRRHLASLSSAERRRLCASQPNACEDYGSDTESPPPPVCQCPTISVIDKLSDVLPKKKKEGPFDIDTLYPTGEYQYVLRQKQADGSYKLCDANPLLEDEHYAWDNYELSRRRLSETDGLDSIGALGEDSLDMDELQAGAPRRSLLNHASGTTACTDSEILSLLAFQAVTKCDQFCGDDKCAGKVFYSTFLEMDGATCARKNKQKEPVCDVKTEAMVQTTSGFRNNIKSKFPSDNSQKGLFDASSFGPDDLVTNSKVKSDTRNIGIRDADNKIGKVAYAWTISTFVPTATFVDDVKAGKFNHKSSVLNTARADGFLKAGATYCAAVFNAWRDPSPQRAQSCSPNNPFECRDSSDYLLPDCKAIPDPNNPGKAVEICKKQRQVIWILAKKGTSKRILPVWDTELYADTASRVPGKAALPAFDKPCEEPTTVPQRVNDNGRGANPINIIASTFTESCDVPDECLPVPPCPCPSPPPPTPPTPPPPPPPICPTCDCPNRRRLFEAPGYQDSSLHVLRSSILVNTPCKGASYMQNLALAEAFVKTASDILGLPVVAESITCDFSEDVAIKVAVIFGKVAPAAAEISVFEDKAFPAFVDSVRETVAVDIMMRGTMATTAPELLEFIASAGFDS